MFPLECHDNKDARLPDILYEPLEGVPFALPLNKFQAVALWDHGVWRHAANVLPKAIQGGGR